jgi:gamma-glutamylcyclotransferase (GGCT)/AIG2-like uncharacterized protein YtfP
MPAPDRVALFVYGSLRSGGANHGLVDRHAAGREEAVAVGELIGGPVDFPPARFGTGGTDSVSGELVWLERGTAAIVLADLDAYEGDAYRRVQVTARTRGGASVTAYVYEWCGGEA